MTGPNIIRVKEVCARTGCSLDEAKRIVTRLDLIDDTESSVTVEELRGVVKRLIIEVLK